MSITLHSAAEQVRELLDQIDPETGELPPEYGTARALVERKALAVAGYIDDGELIADAYEARAKAILAEVRTKRSGLAHLRRYLCEHMAALDLTELRGPDGQVLKRYPERDKSVDVFDAQQLPARLFAIPPPPPPVPDKRRIKAELEAGGDVPGARIAARDRLVLK